VTVSVTFCLRGLAYLHNETVNIFSHLVPAITAPLLTSLTPRYFGSHFPKATWQDLLVIQIYLLTSAFCFSVSAIYYTFLCYSEGARDLSVRIDYAAILV